MATVSVIVPVYNGAEFVAAALDSALAQTHADAEVIAIDDGSTDATPAVLARFAARVRVLRQTNRGLSAARNAGLAAANGAYVALLDADDTWDPSFLEVALARLAELDESVVGVFAGWVLTDRSGRAFPHTQTIRHGTFAVRDFLRRAPFLPSTVTLRRAAVLAAGGFDEALRATEDWDLWLRLTAAGASFVALERCLCHYRVHEQNWSRDPERMRTGALRTLEKFFANPALPDDLRAERAPAFAHVQARASAQFYAAGRAEEGARALCEAASTWPAILLEDETHWAIVCAEQPIGYKATPQHLDLAQGERRIHGALEHCVASAVGLDRPLQRRAYGRAYRTLAQLAYGQGRMDAARRYAARALRADRSLRTDWGTIGPLVKSLAGPAVIDTLRRWRRGAG